MSKAGETKPVNTQAVRRELQRACMLHREGFRSTCAPWTEDSGFGCLYLIVYLIWPKITCKDVEPSRSGCSVGISVEDCHDCYGNCYGKPQTTSGWHYSLGWDWITEKMSWALESMPAFLLFLSLFVLLPWFPCSVEELWTSGSTLCLLRFYKSQTNGLKTHPTGCQFNIKLLPSF